MSEEADISALSSRELLLPECPSRIIWGAVPVSVADGFIPNALPGVTYTKTGRAKPEVADSTAVSEKERTGSLTPTATAATS